MIQISKFARMLYRLDGTVIKLQDKNIVHEIIHHNRINDNPELRSIYQKLMLEVQDIIAKMDTNNHLSKASSTKFNNISTNR